MSSELKIVVRTGMKPNRPVLAVEAGDERDNGRRVVTCDCGDEHQHENETNEQWQKRCHELGADFGRMINHLTVSYWREGLIAALTGDAT